eukprot:scaffold2021_cov176-Amphora_coffeaeformis.AAC.19
MLALRYDATVEAVPQSSSTGMLVLYYYYYYYYKQVATETWKRILTLLTRYMVRLATDDLFFDGYHQFSWGKNSSSREFVCEHLTIASDPFFVAVLRYQLAQEDLDIVALHGIDFGLDFFHGHSTRRRGDISKPGRRIFLCETATSIRRTLFNSDMALAMRPTKGSPKALRSKARQAFRPNIQARGTVEKFKIADIVWRARSGWENNHPRSVTRSQLHSHFSTVRHTVNRMFDNTALPYDVMDTMLEWTDSITFDVGVVFQHLFYIECRLMAFTANLLDTK